MGRAQQKAITEAVKPTGSSAVAAGEALLNTASLSGSVSRITQREVPKSLALERHIHSSINTGMAVPVLAFQTRNLRRRTMQMHALGIRVTEHEQRLLCKAIMK